MPAPPAERTVDAIAQAMTAPAPRPAPAVPAAVREAVAPPAVQAPSVQAPPAWLPEPRFDLSVSDAPAAQVFLAIASDTRYSMLLPPNLPGKVTIHLKDVTVREALEALRELYGYEYRIDGKRVYVMPQGLQTRIFRINYLAVTRQGRSDIRVSTGSQEPVPGQLGAAGAPVALAGATALPQGAQASRNVEASRLVTRTESDFWSGLSSSLQAIVGAEAGRSVVVNPIAGVVVVRATAAEQRQVEQYLRAMQIAVERQVMLEAKILEVSLRDGNAAGINWAAFDSLGRHRWSFGADPTTLGVDRTARNPDGSSSSLGQLLGGGVAAAASALGRTAPNLFGLAFQTASFQALIAFLETQGRVHVMSNPRIATLNNQKAVLKVGTDDFFVTNVTTNTVTAGATATSSPTITVQPFFSGIALDVTPQIDEDGQIILHVHPSVSVVTERTKDVNLGTMGTYRLPLASSAINETDSIVRVPDGNIAAIGGLMMQETQESRTQVPVVGDVPAAGTLFGGRTRRFEKRELVILIKPTVIRSERDWAEDLTATRERVSAYGGQPPLVPARVFPPPSGSQ
jgi:MSHA biogenesis protein MshL